MTFSVPSLPSFPTLDASQLSAVSSVSIPGANLSPTALAANAANAAGLNALPSAASITTSLTPGGGGLPDITALFAPLAASPVAIPGLSTIQSTITTFQSNIGLHLSVMQAGIQDQLKSANLNGTPPPDPNALASSMSSSMFAPLTNIGSVVSNAISSGLTAIATEIAKGPLGNPSSAAASVGSSMTSSVGSLTGQTAAQIASIVAPMKASAMASVLSGSMGQLPAIQSMMSGLGVPVPSAFAVARNMQNSVPMPSAMPIPPYSDKQFASAPISENASIPKPASADVQVTQAMCDYAIAQFKTAQSVVMRFYGGSPSNSSSQNQALYDAWVNSLLPDGGDVRTKRSALIDSKPDSSTWTDDEKVLDSVYKSQMKAATASGAYSEYLAALDHKVTLKSYGYEIIGASASHTSKYTLTTGCQSYLTAAGY
jgi:hypothetical protein